MSLIEAGKEAIIVQDGCNLSGVVHAFDVYLGHLVDGGNTDGAEEHDLGQLPCDFKALLLQDGGPFKSSFV